MQGCEAQGSPDKGGRYKTCTTRVFGISYALHNVDHYIQVDIGK
jgi:hypothetical protein